MWLRGPFASGIAAVKGTNPWAFNLGVDLVLPGVVGTYRHRGGPAAACQLIVGCWSSWPVEDPGGRWFWLLMVRVGFVDSRSHRPQTTGWREPRAGVERCSCWVRSESWRPGGAGAGGMSPVGVMLRCISQHLKSHPSHLSVLNCVSLCAAIASPA